MSDSGASEKKPIEEAEEFRARVAKLERSAMIGRDSKRSSF